uniref:Uncharacterized protein n=1 Tax=Salix viminalis TaxID=40686 RepID=A0A6N2N9C9_SALVM
MSNWGKKPLTISTFNPVLKIGRTELGGLGWSARDVDDTWTISLLMKLAPPLSPLPGKVDTEAGES